MPYQLPRPHDEVTRLPRGCFLFLKTSFSPLNQCKRPLHRHGMSVEMSSPDAITMSSDVELEEPPHDSSSNALTVDEMLSLHVGEVLQIHISEREILSCSRFVCPRQRPTTHLTRQSHPAYPRHRIRGWSTCIIPPGGSPLTRRVRAEHQ